MPRFEELAPDQKAVLQLLLKQGKSYDDIAGLLRLNRSSVRERALDALDALGADAPGSADLAPERQDELADHLLLQQDASQRQATRTFLEGSAPGRAWARAVAGELRPVGGDALPEVPAEPAEIPVEPAERPVAVGAPDERAGSRRREAKSSKLGGLLILLAVGALLGLGLVYLLTRGKDDKPSTASTSVETTPAATSCAGGTSTTATFATQQVNLRPPRGSGLPKALGVGIIQQNALQFQIKGLSRTKSYKVWLWSTPADSVPLGFIDFTKQPSKTQVAGSVPALPPEAVGCRSLVITRETAKNSRTPGPVVLAGALKRG